MDKTPNKSAALPFSRTPRGRLGCRARVDRGVAGTVAFRERGPVGGAELGEVMTNMTNIEWVISHRLSGWWFRTFFSHILSIIVPAD